MSEEQQIWFCEKCQKVSQTLIDAQADVMTVVQALGRSHRELSPICPTVASGLRILDTEFALTHSEWKTQVPEWVVKPAQTFLVEQVLVAQSKLEELLPEAPSMGTMFGRGEHGPILVVMVQAKEVPEGLPQSVNRVPVTYRIIGRVVAQDE